jgi:hypothetical protein
MHRRLMPPPIVALLATLLLAGCGAAAARTTVILTPPPRSVHAPPGFTSTACPSDAPDQNRTCFARAKSLALTPRVVLNLAEAAGITAQLSDTHCGRLRHPVKPQLLLEYCKALGVSSATAIGVGIRSLVFAGPRAIAPTTSDPAAPGLSLPPGRSIMLEILSFGPAAKTAV